MSEQSSTLCECYTTGTFGKNYSTNLSTIEKYHLIFSKSLLKFIYSEEATKFWEIFTLLLTTVHIFKSKVKISQNFVAFSEYMNFITPADIQKTQKTSITAWTNVVIWRTKEWKTKGLTTKLLLLLNAFYPFDHYSSSIEILSSWLWY